MIRVLIADDEPDVCLLLKLQLELLPDFEVVGTARTGAEAIEQCFVLRPDAVIMDLLMPGTNGFEAIDQVHSEIPEVGIIAYTGVAGDFVRDEMARQGIRLVLKSGEVGPLVDALRAVATHAPW